MNETLNTLLKRRSVRKYLDKPVEKEVYEEVLKAGTYAPTASGKQSPTLVCITNKEDLNAAEVINADVMGKAGSHPFYGAPMAILVLGDADNKNTVYDGSLVMGNLMNAAASLGLGSCWIHRAKETFEREDGKALLKKWGLNGNYVGIGYCILGYTDEPFMADGPARKDNYVVYVAE